MIDESFFLKECPECERVFDLLDQDDINEYTYGHDCEVDND